MGLGLMVLSLPFSFYSSIADVDYNTLYQTAYYIAILGAIIMAGAGIIARPRWLWVAAIIAGVAYMASLYGWLMDNDAGFSGVSMVLVPGFVAVLFGLVLRRFIVKPQKGGKKAVRRD